jgi:hypothetical protein
VPRKASSFQKDLFPEAYAGVPALEAKAWLAGENKDAVLQSMKPGEAKATGSATFSTSKVDVAALQAELAAAKATIAALTAEVAQLKAQ